MNDFLSWSLATLRRLVPAKLFLVVPANSTIAPASGDRTKSMISVGLRGSWLSDTKTPSSMAKATKNERTPEGCSALRSKLDRQSLIGSLVLHGVLIFQRDDDHFLYHFHMNRGHFEQLEAEGERGN